MHLLLRSSFKTLVPGTAKTPLTYKLSGVGKMAFLKRLMGDSDAGSLAQLKDWLVGTH